MIFLARNTISSSSGDGGSRTVATWLTMTRRAMQCDPLVAGFHIQIEYLPCVERLHWPKSCGKRVSAAPSWVAEF